MVIYCCAYNCNNREDKKDRNVGPRLSFHSLPYSNPELLARWIAAIRRSDLPLNNSSQLCSDHFEPSCVVRSLGGIRKRLRPGSIPTKFDFTKPTKRTMKILAPADGESIVHCKRKIDEDIFECEEKITVVKSEIKYLEQEKELVLQKKKIAEDLLEKYF